VPSEWKSRAELSHARRPGRRPAKALSEPQKALHKLGLVRDIDLALHLPLRYEDETRIVKLRDAREGDTVQIEATVTDSQVAVPAAPPAGGDGGRRQRHLRAALLQLLSVAAEGAGGRHARAHPRRVEGRLPRLADGASDYKRGRRRAARGADAGLSHRRPPCRRPTCARRCCPGWRAPTCRRRCRRSIPQLGLREPWTLRQALHFLHHPTPDTSLATLEDRSHPAWQRLKAEELLAQQLSQLQSRRERDACARRRCAPSRRAARAVAGGAAVPADGRAAPRQRGDRQDLAAPSRCTACCRATSAPARPWWRRWPRPSPSMPAGSAR
jgi:ATP-dependent DNA helicase RecG